MSKTRRSYDPDFKARVALEALKEQKTLSELAAEFELNPNLISKWKNQALSIVDEVFTDKPDEKAKADQKLIDNLEKQIDQLQIEIEWLRRKTGQTKPV